MVLQESNVRNVGTCWLFHVNADIFCPVCHQKRLAAACALHVDRGCFLWGRCERACPKNIPIPDMLISALVKRVPDDKYIRKCGPKQFSAQPIACGVLFGVPPLGGSVMFTFRRFGEQPDKKRHSYHISRLLNKAVKSLLVVPFMKYNH